MEMDFFSPATSRYFSKIEALQRPMLPTPRMKAPHV
jgi:hypothetical protein